MATKQSHRQPGTGCSAFLQDKKKVTLLSIVVLCVIAVAAVALLAVDTTEVVALQSTSDVLKTGFNDEKEKLDKTIMSAEALTSTEETMIRAKMLAQKLEELMGKAKNTINKADVIVGETGAAIREARDKLKGFFKLAALLNDEETQRTIREDVKDTEHVGSLIRTWIKRLVSPSREDDQEPTNN